MCQRRSFSAKPPTRKNGEANPSEMKPTKAEFLNDASTEVSGPALWASYRLQPPFFVGLGFTA